MCGMARVAANSNATSDAINTTAMILVDVSLITLADCCILNMSVDTRDLIASLKTILSWSTSHSSEQENNTRDAMPTIIGGFLKKSNTTEQMDFALNFPLSAESDI